MDHYHDVLGIGFGPANLSLAIALQENESELTTHFFEAQRDLTWQGGMMLSGSNIQNHPSRDLVCLRNPRSRYTFLNYLFENDRLIEHLNLPDGFPLRKEYAQYVRWVTDQFAEVVDFGSRATGVALVERDGMLVYEVSTHGGEPQYANSLVLAPGRTPYVPAPFDAVHSPRVIHLADYLYRLKELGRPPRSVAVIGGSQSAVELVLDLAKRYPQARVVNYVRSFSLRLKDTSPFSEEGYFPVTTNEWIDLVEDSSFPPIALAGGKIMRTGTVGLLDLLGRWQDAGVNHGALGVQLGSRPRAEVVQQLAEEVVPYFPAHTHCPPPAAPVW